MASLVFNPSTKEGSCKFNFKTNLIYIQSARPSGATKWEPASKQGGRQNKSLWLWAHTALAKDLSSPSRIHVRRLIRACNSNSRSWQLPDSVGTHVHMCTYHLHTHTQSKKKKKKSTAKGMAQWLTVLAVVPEVLSLVNTHSTWLTCLQHQLQRTWCPILAQGHRHTPTQMYTYLKKNLLCLR